MRRFAPTALRLALVALAALNCDGPTSIGAPPEVSRAPAPPPPPPPPPAPRPTGALVVDSFTVIEYRALCVWDCPYLVYAPLLKLRESTNSGWATVEGVEFTIPGMSTGMCRGTATYSPGQSHHLNYIDPYLWSNDLILVRLDGTPVPDGPATARVLVRDMEGHYGMVEVSAPIQRMVKSPNLPAPPSGWQSGWTCNFGN